ncbi:hypothetical protein Q0V21_17655 [Paenibacillus sp. 11B]|nr:hypothetical protein [Paenibacillus sp. 11B]MDN8590602.1 hypothetical protein [Paenibacillus sp. 11B]
MSESRIRRDPSKPVKLVPEEKVSDPNTTKLAVSLSAKEYLEERTESLLQRLHWISDHIDELDGVNLENGKLHIDRLEKDAPDESRNFSLSLYELLPRIKLTERLETKQSPKDAAFALLGLSLLSF